MNKPYFKKFHSLVYRISYSMMERIGALSYVLVPYIRTTALYILRKQSNHNFIH